jgi:hypothetical protein
MNNEHKKPTEQQLFRSLLDQTLESGPYAKQDKLLHYIWCTGFLKELLTHNHNMDVGNHLQNTLDKHNK